MSRVSCINCGEEDDARRCPFVPHAKGTFALAPSMMDGQCSWCRQSSFTNSEPL